MKKVMLLLLLLVPMVAAQDIEFFINDAPAADFEVSPGQQLNFAIKMARGVKVNDVVVDTDSVFIKQMIENGLKQSYNREPAERTVTKMVSMPGTMPNLDHDVKITLKYSDASLQDQSMYDTFHVSSPEGSKFISALMGMVSEQAQVELTNWLTGYQIPRLNKDFTMDDLTADDLTGLGVSAEEVLSGQKVPAITPLNEKESKYRGPEGTNFDSLGGSVTPEVIVTIKSFKVIVDGNEITKSKITFSIADELKGVLGMSNLELIVDVPKEVAAKASELDVSENMDILVEDPVIKWAMKNVPQDQVKDYAFTTDGDATNFDVLASAAAEKPSFMGRFLAWIISTFK